MSQTQQLLLQEEMEVKCPVLDNRYSDLKKSIIQAENAQRVIESYSRLKKALKVEAKFIAKVGPDAIPSIKFLDLLSNDGRLPEGAVDLIRERGCVIVQGVVSEEQAIQWESDLKEYTQRHAAVGGVPENNPQNWNLWWTPAQVQIRSHPSVLKAMNAISMLWHVSNDKIPIDLSTQVVYPDRFRIRYPSTDQEYTLPAHQDTGAIERWEDPEYRACYEKIFEGKWEEYDAYNVDHRLEAKTSLYDSAAQCSAFRSMQGWLSLSHTGTGEGTLRLMPNIKLSTAYMMLRPFFVQDEIFDDKTATFPGATPGSSQFFPTTDLHPHLELERTIVGIPPVKPGDYVFWHCDLIHEVDKYHPGTRDSSVSYNACVPLCPYNVTNLLHVRESFRDVVPTRDFRGLSMGHELEKEHKDHGAKVENILSVAGKQALGLEQFDINDEGLTEGQRLMRQKANEILFGNGSAPLE